MQSQYSQLRVLRRHVDLLRVSSALCPGNVPVR
ncbi:MULTISPECIES: putative leader peptide [Catenulispora]